VVVSEVIRYAEVIDRAVRSGSSSVAFIGVDGPAGSGKSTFAVRLSAVADEAVIAEVDDFFCWGDMETWWPRLLHEAVEPLLTGRAARFQIRAWADDPLGGSLGPWKTLRPAPLVVLEGIGATRQQLAGALSVTVWVEADLDTRLRRGVERDGEAMRSVWMAFMDTEARFFDHDGTRERADYLVSGAADLAPDPLTEFAGIRRK
jgi:hypothetical protein